MQPMEAKTALSALLHDRFHGEGAGLMAREGCESQFSKGQLPDDIPEAELAAAGGGLCVVHALTRAGLTQSNGEAMRLIGQGALSVDGEKVSDKECRLAAGGSYLIKLGKRRYLQLAVR